MGSERAETSRMPYRHFPIAAYKFFRPDKVIFAATQEAAQHENCLKVKEALKDKVEIVIIPDGSSDGRIVGDF